MESRFESVIVAHPDTVKVTDHHLECRNENEFDNDSCTIEAKVDKNEFHIHVIYRTTHGMISRLDAITATVSAHDVFHFESARGHEIKMYNVTFRGHVDIRFVITAMPPEDPDFDDIKHYRIVAE